MSLNHTHGDHDVSSDDTIYLWPPVEHNTEVRLTTSVINFILLSLTFLIYWRFKHDPIIFCRSTVLVFMSWTLTMYSMLGTVLSRHKLDIDFNYQSTVSATYNMALISCIAYFSAIARHYFLVRVSAMRKDLLSHEPEEIPAHLYAIRRIQNFAVDSSAWTFLIVHCVIVGTTGVFMGSFMGPLEYETAKIEPFSMTVGILIILECVAGLCLIIYILVTQPEDNMRIRFQYLLTVVLGILAVIFTASAKWVRANSETAQRILDSIGYILVTCIVGIQFFIPAYVLYYNRMRQMVPGDGSWSTHFFTVVMNSSGNSSSNPSKSPHQFSGSNSGYAERAERLTRMGTHSQNVRSKQSEPNGEGANNAAISPVQHEKITRNKKKEELLRILETPDLQAVFAKYLERKFAVENLLFLNSLKRLQLLFEGNAPWEAVKEEVANIVADFLEPGSVNELNVPSIVRSAAFTEFYDFRVLKTRPNKITVFNDVEKCVIQNLVDNDLRKFKDSDLYKVFEQNRPALEQARNAASVQDLGI